MKSIKNIIPKHLKKYIIKQDYSQYNEINQSTWRFIMAISIDFFKKYGHNIYLEGLNKTGISLNKIPKISDINSKLNKFNWGALPVRGFIPPNAFMEFQSLKILPIAADIRTHKHLIYTPTPDIVHEAAGHAPIIANKDYSNYLINYGEVANKAIISSDDINLYYAIRALSNIKEKPHATKNEIEKYDQKLKEAYQNITYTSESALLSRMNWWTVEYGLIGNINNYKIYGAGLLSSVEESENCLDDTIKKIPFSIDCINYNYDITEQQPQLFITKNFKQLSKVLNQFSNKMSFKIGGEYGLKKAIRAKTLCTIEIDENIQISGIIEKFISKNNKPIFIKTTGGTQLSYKGRELKNHGTGYHVDGYSCPIGKLKRYKKPINKLSDNELKTLNIKINHSVKLEFLSGIKLTGTIKKINKRCSKIILIKFNNCTIKYNNKFLFRPKWGYFDLICGESINSVYGGVADKLNYTKEENKKYENHDKKESEHNNSNLNKLHKQSKLITKKYSDKKLLQLFNKAVNKYPEEWLIQYELLKISNLYSNIKLSNKIKKSLNKFIHNKNPESKVIKRGLDLIK
jgi:phenylalanine-4-hydroxylase